MFSFATQCGHHGEIKPVRKVGGVCEGKWSCRIRGPKVFGVSGIKTVYANPSVQDASFKIAAFLHVPISSIQVAQGSSPQRARTVPDVPASFTVTEIPSLGTMVPMSPPSASMLTLPRAVATPPRASDDKVETSPNNQATCQQKIRIGEVRVGRKIYNEAYDRYNCYYYHKTCCSDTFLRSLHFPAGHSLEEELGLQQLAKDQQATTVRERSELWEAIRSWRRAIAVQKGVGAYIVFSNKTIDDIVLKMPRTPSALLACNGIGPKKLADYGADILGLVRNFHFASH